MGISITLDLPGTWQISVQCHLGMFLLTTQTLLSEHDKPTPRRHRRQPKNDPAPPILFALASTLADIHHSPPATDTCAWGSRGVFKSCAGDEEISCVLEVAI